MPDYLRFFDIRVEANTSQNQESESGRGRKLNLATISGSDPETNQQVDISESGKSATITFAVKLNKDSEKNNAFTVTVYGESRRTFGANGILSQPKTMKGTLKMKLQPPKPLSVRETFLKKNPFQEN